MCDLRQAYYDARRHKRRKPFQIAFEGDLEGNLSSLCDDLMSGTYKPQPSTCFLIREPKIREVFAAQFRDRIVHHLYYNYTHKLFERTFIADSYSCIKGRGTHNGIERLTRHIRQVSQNWQEQCYVLKMDIRGYFMHIERQRLLDIVMRNLIKMSKHKVSSNSSSVWADCIDIDFVGRLSREIILLDPILDCKRIGEKKEWAELPKDKSLFHSPDNCGLPIGNLTSQLFSNVYLNELDQFVKRELKCRHYGRYVDDFFIVDSDRQWLRNKIPMIRDFLADNLGLELHEGKVRIYDAMRGVDFLGAFIKPFRNYVSNATLSRMEKKIKTLNRKNEGHHLQSRINSYLGILSHYASFRIQCDLFLPLKICFDSGSFVYDGKKLVWRDYSVSNRQYWICDESCGE